MESENDQLAAAQSNVMDVQESVWLAHVLRGGVLIAGALVLLGLALFLAGGHGGPSTLDEALGKHAEVQRVHPRDIIDGARHGSSGAIILTGLLVLILTPTARVALTFVLFLQRKESIFAILAGVVLILLLLGLVGIGA